MNKVLIILCAGLGMIETGVLGQTHFLFRNFEPPVVDAPVLDSQDVPLAGTGYLAELWGGATADSLAPLVSLDSGLSRQIKPFATGGYVIPDSGGRLSVVSILPGGWAWLELRAWDASLGDTYEEVAALGIGGYGESPLFYAKGGDPFDQFPVPGALIGLQSFSLRLVVPEPSTWGLMVLGGTTLLWAARRRT